ncbi:MAG: PEPxxWA-CTERM sorting domain-containing protein [Sphingomonas sp.]|nr:PEPxxWA-CTERM sorting domain-containing protein [Sphingomonas sp.]
MGKIILAAAIAALGSLPAMASVTVSSVDGASPYGVPATFQFDGATPQYSGTIYTDSVGGVRAQPAGSTGGYGAVGPSNAQSSADLDLSAFGAISSITLLWGSVDTYNLLSVLGTGLSFNGGDEGVSPSNGNQVNPSSNRLVTLTFTGADRWNVTGLQFSSTGNAFEFDNVNVVTAGVPEPASWALMLGGFGAIGFAMRSRRKAALSFS